ncbi:MAG: ATP-dependent helicase [Clostridium sp.]|nr:ATP-dependent helicase [Clostridium sp.]
MTDTLQNIKDIVDGLNEAQTQAVLNPLESCTKIVAGAGTGKTKIISKRFLKLVLDLIERGGKDPQSKILVITFTDKAANEMKERIIKELEDNSLHAYSDTDLWISTFHSFCIRILKKYSIEAGLSPSFKMAEEQQLQEIYSNLVKKIKYGEANQEVLSVESIARLNKISDLDTLFDDIYNVIKKIKSLGITPQEFLHSSLKATADFSNVMKNTPFKFETKEDYAANWAQHFKDYTDDSTVLDEAVFDSIAKAKLVLDKFGKRKASEYGMAQGFPENIEPVTQAELLLTRVIAAVYELYQTELENHDLADFDDLINKTIMIFKQNEQIRSFYQNYFKQIIVDEFQDTNGAQLELIELLLNPDNPDLTFVGDRKQSIYAFRYAQMENLEVLHKNAEKKYSKKFEPVNLSINYRSTPQVLNAVNFVTQNELKLEGENLNANPNLTYPDSARDIKVTRIEGFENAYEQKITEASYIAQEISSLLKRDNASFKDFAVLVKSHAQADIVERELKKKNIPAVKKVNTGFFKEPVVKNVISAFRLIKNSEDEQALFRLLKVNFTDAEIFEIKKSLDKELLCQTDFDTVKRMNLAQKYITLKTLDKTSISYLEKIYDTVNKIKKHKSSLSLMQIFEIIKENICLYNCSDFSSEFEQENAKNNLLILEKIIDDFTQSENFLSINTLLNYLEKIQDDRNFELPSVNTLELDAVQILTIHASKGLEFPYVFVLSIASSSKTADKSGIIFDMQYGEKPGFGIIASKYKGKPTAKALIYKQLWQKPREKNEALRLFYVAVSRAKKYLNVLSFEPYASVKPVEYIENLSQYLSS